MGIDIAQERAERAEKKRIDDEAKASAAEKLAKNQDNRNLIKCKACEGYISKNAESCPHCGEPLKKQTKQRKTAGCISIVVIFVFLLWIYSMFSDNNKKPQTDAGYIKPYQPTIESPKEVALAKIQLDQAWHLEGFGNILEVDFKITNLGNDDVRDIEITCQSFAKSGTLIDTNTRTIFEILAKNETKKIDKFNMGFVHNQTEKLGCKVTDLKL